MERLRDVLEQSRRATDKVTSIVKHTDAQLLELQELMGPVQERAQSLSNAHKNLTAVRDETRTWLDHLEAINDAEARLERAFEDEDPDEPTGPDAFLRCVDRVAQAERFFGERRSFEGADAGWRRAGEILGLCLRACEREFQKLVAAQNRDRRESSRRASLPDGKALRATAETLRRVAPAPPPPFGTEAWDAHVARQGSGADPDASGSAPPPAATDGSHHDSRSAEKTPRRLAALARTLLTHSAEARETTKRLYVAARVAALDETMAAFMSPDASAALADASERAHASLRAAAADNRHCDVSLLFGDGAAYVAEADARVAALAAMTKKWSAEPRVARAAFAFDDLEVSEHEPADLDRLGVDLALCTAPAIVAASAARALAWVDEAAARMDPARAFGLLAARARLTRLRWAMETSAARDAFGEDVFVAWDGATASAERGAKRALLEVGGLIARATETLKTRTAKPPGVVFVPSDAARRAEDAAALVRSAAAFLARVSERDDTRAVLFGGVGKSAHKLRGSEDEDAAFAAFASVSLEAATNVAFFDATKAALAQTPATAAKKASGKPPAALAAALLAAAADEAVSASGASEAARRAFGEAWPARAHAIASARVDAYVSAAWGRALEAMDPEGAPPGSGLTEKQRQAVKDRFTAVNAAVDESSRSGQAEWRFPRPETARALRSATEQAVVTAYAAFYRRYKDSGFTRKHPEKYIKHSPEALGEIVSGLFAGDASDV